METTSHITYIPVQRLMCDVSVVNLNLLFSMWMTEGRVLHIEPIYQRCFDIISHSLTICGVRLDCKLFHFMLRLNILHAGLKQHQSFKIIRPAWGTALWAASMCTLWHTPSWACIITSSQAPWTSTRSDGAPCRLQLASSDHTDPSSSWEGKSGCPEGRPQKLSCGGWCQDCG